MMDTPSTQGFALYRLPHADRCTLVQGATKEFRACTELNGQSGFVVAPFAVTDREPIIIIQPQRTSIYSVADADSIELPSVSVLAEGVPSGGNRSHYAIDFANFHAHLLSGEFSKLVLARCSVAQADADLQPLQLFRQACDRYPRLFIALVCTPKSGLWLTATPEILLEGEHNHWRTIALAGTIKLTNAQLPMDVPAVDWSIKNIQEQRYVATYITECLEQFTKDFREEGPRTARAANLVHLRSDFTFTLYNNARIGDLLQALHPTPAVCGLPKRDAFRFITSNEHSPRRYYSGFLGMLDPQGHTHLYVSLRCMQMVGRTCYLYAGGGLLKESTEEQEWNETEAKLETMRQLIPNSHLVIRHS